MGSGDEPEVTCPVCGQPRRERPRYKGRYYATCGSERCIRERVRENAQRHTLRLRRKRRA